MHHTDFDGFEEAGDWSGHVCHFGEQVVEVDAVMSVIVLAPFVKLMGGVSGVSRRVAQSKDLICSLGLAPAASETESGKLVDGIRLLLIVSGNMRGSEEIVHKRTASLDPAKHLVHDRLNVVR